MSEIEALLGLYGAVDRAVDDGFVPAEALAPLLGAYRFPSAVGWYAKQYQPWLEELTIRARERGTGERPIVVREPDEPADPRRGRRDPIPPPVRPIDLHPDRDGPRRPEPLDDGPRRDREVDLRERVDDIREALDAFETIPLQGRAAARRLLAVAVVARALPQFFGSDGVHADAARSALTFSSPDGDPGYAGPEHAFQLHVVVTREFTSMSEWSNVVANAVSGGMLPMSFMSQAAVPPCTGSLVLRADPNSPGDPDPCLVMESEFTTDQLTFAAAKKYLVPQNWVYPGSLWCRMDQDTSLGKDTWLYHETVATSCPPESATWSVSANLQFWFSHPQSWEARVEYDFPPGEPGKLSDIEVDEGSLRILNLGKKGILVKTTKRVRFAGSMDGAGLAMFLCATGYSSILEDIVFRVATTPTTSLKPFPVEAPPGGAMPDSKTGQAKAGNTKTGQKTQATTAGEDSLEAISKDAADYVGAYLKDASTTATKSLASIQAGTYKVENAWADGIKLWSDYLTNLTKVVELGTRTAKVYASKPLDEK